MKSCKKPLIVAFTAGALLFGGALLAQDVPAPPPPPATPATPVTPPTPPTPMTPATPTSDSVDIPTANGSLVVNSMPAKAPAMAPAPSFEQLSGGGKSISESQADAYPPLANDFINADRNRDGKISKAEYQRWLKQL